MDSSPKRPQSKPRRPNYKRKGSRVKVDFNRKNNQLNARKERFIQLMQQQREIEQSKKAKRQMIMAKRQAREEKRAERNKAWRKLTKKGQPIMKDRINYMLKELEREHIIGYHYYVVIHQTRRDWGTISCLPQPMRHVWVLFDKRHSSR